MILLDGPIEVLGVTLYRDHAAPGCFHYLPGPPRPATEAGIQLMRFRGERAGGVLTLDADLAWPDATLRAVRETLEAQGMSDVTLTPVLFRAGVARLTTLGVDASSEVGSKQSLVERVIGAAEPSLLGRQRVAFSITLSPEGASLARAALEGSTAPMILAYELTFAGLVPARGLRARVRYHMGYERLRARAQGGALWASADLDRESERLRSEGIVEIEDVDYRGDDAAALAARRRDAEATARELVETVFFRPAASPWALGVEGASRDPATREVWEGGGRPRALFALRALRQDEQQTLSYDLTATAVALRCVAPQGPLRLPVGAQASAHMIEVTVGDETPVTLRALCPPDVDWTGVGAIVVDVRSDTEVRSLTLSPERPDASLTLPGGPHEYRASARRDDGAGGGEEAAWRPLAQGTLVLDPAALSGRRALEIVAGAVDPAVVKRIGVRVWQDDAHDDFALGVDAAALRVSVRRDAVVRVEAALTLADRQEVVVTPRVSEREPLVVINVSSDLFRVVAVELQDPLERYESVIVELERAQGESRRVVRVDRASPSARWWFPPRAEGARGFRYRARTLGRDGSERQGPWRDGYGGVLVVGDTDLRVETITGVLAAPADHLGALVTLTSLSPPADGPAEVECALDAGALEFRVAVPFLRDAPRRYRVRAQVFLDGGELVAELAEETAEVLVVDFAPR